MPTLSNQQILDAGLRDWRKLAQGLHARFRTGDFATGTTFLAAIADAAARADRYPEIRITPPLVHLRLSTREDGWSVTERDIDLARRISEVAEQHGVPPEPTAVAQFELALDIAVAAQGRFWAVLLTGSADNHVEWDVIDPDGRLPTLWFQETDPHETPRQRFHVDLWLPHDVADERIAAAVDAGGSVVDDRQAPAFTVLADPEGNRVCICTCLGR